MLETGAVIDDYRILGHLGSGAIGQVYLARQQRLDRLVAMKVLDPQRAQRQGFSSEHFLAEARAAAALSHPNIVAVHDVASLSIAARDHYYLVMEYVDGEDVQDLIDREQRISDDDFRRIMRGAIDALSYAAQRGFTHRDVKPANIMLGHDGRVKLADFGLAVRSGTDLGGLIIGTPRYLSPEQARGGRVDHRSDQYSLGCIIYQLLTGVPPFESDDNRRLLAMHKHDPVPLAHEVVDCDQRWSELAARLMSKAMDQRFDDPKQLQALVHDLCADDGPLLSTRAAPSRQALRRRRRRSQRRQPRVVAERARPGRSPRPTAQSAAPQRRQGPTAQASLGHRRESPPPAADSTDEAWYDDEVDAETDDHRPSLWTRLREASADRIADLWEWLLVLVATLASVAIWCGLRVWDGVLWCLPHVRRAIHGGLPFVFDVYCFAVAWTWRVRVVRGYDHVLSAADDGHGLLAFCPHSRHLPMAWWLAQHPEVCPAQRLYARAWWILALRHLRWRWRQHPASPAARHRQALAQEVRWARAVAEGATWSCSVDRHQRGAVDLDMLSAACMAGARVLPITMGSERSWLHRQGAQRMLVPAPWATIVIAVGRPIPLQPQADPQLMASIIAHDVADLQASLNGMTGSDDPWQPLLAD